jgi:hypothetical protein
MLPAGGGAGRDTGIQGELLAAATPELYRNNAFRLAGVPVDATARDLRRRGEQVRAVQALGGTVDVTGPLPPARPPGPDAVAEAIARLHDPVKRIVDELFWFWPDPPDDGFAALAAGDQAAAQRIWAAATTDVTALHNLAVLCHARALDAPADATAALFDAALRHWLALCGRQPFWDRVADRIRRLDHPGLGPDAVAALRAELPACLALINANLAVRASDEERDDASATTHWRLARHPDIPEPAVRRAVRLATHPVFDRIAARCTTAEQELGRDPLRGPAVAADLHTGVEPLLHVLDLAALPGATVARDNVARLLRTCGLAYQTTGDWPGVRAALALAQRTARGAELAGQIATDLRNIDAYMRILEQRARRDEETERRYAQEERHRAAVRRYMERMAAEEAERRRQETEEERRRRVETERRREAEEERRRQTAERYRREAEEERARYAEERRRRPADPAPAPRPVQEPATRPTTEPTTEPTTQPTTQPTTANQRDLHACQYCGRTAGVRSDVPVTMVRADQTRVVTVPRCRVCRWRHGFARIPGPLLVVAATVAAVAGVYAAPRPALLAVAAALLAGAAVIRRGRRRWTRTRRDRTHEYLPLVMMKEVGWTPK